MIFVHMCTGGQRNPYPRIDGEVLPITRRLVPSQHQCSAKSLSLEVFGFATWLQIDWKLADKWKSEVTEHCLEP